MTMEMNIIRIIVVGDKGTGKSSLKEHYEHGTFDQPHKSIGIDFCVKNMVIKQQNIRAQIWDTNDFTVGMMIKRLNIDGAFIFFDLSKHKTFDSVIEWKNKLNENEYLTKLNKKMLPIVLIANKSDLARNNITDQDIEKIVVENNFVGWFAISLKENINVEESLVFLAENIISNPEFKFTKYC